MKNARGDRELAVTDTVAVRWVGGEDAHVADLPVESDAPIKGTDNPFDQQDGDVIAGLPLEGAMPSPLVLADEVGEVVVCHQGAAMPVLGRV